MDTRRPVACGVLERGVDHLGDLPPGVDRHEGVAQLVVRGVQAQRQRHGQPLAGELAHRRDEAHRRDGDPAGAHAQAVGSRGDHPAHRPDDDVVVGQRLAHAHEDDVGHPPGPAGHLPARQRPGAGEHLLDDLGGRQVAGQPGLPGGAERAVHPAAGLRRDAHRDPLRLLRVAG